MISTSAVPTFVCVSLFCLAMFINLLILFAAPTLSADSGLRICQLPPYPAHGTYVTNIAGAEPGDSHQQVTIDVVCERGFDIVDPSSIHCVNGVWGGSLPECVRVCQLDPHPSVEYRCLISGSEEGYRSCRRQEPSGTIVSPHCRKPNYFSESILSFMRCVDGSWNYIARCTLECGRVTPEVRLFFGKPMTRGEAPWHAGIYNKERTQICGGSLISNDIVISAAQCFRNEARQLPMTQLAVAVGKLYRAWDSTADDVQKADIKEIQLPLRYQGASANYQEDIAVVIVARAFEFNTFVRPVCIDFDTTFEIRQLSPGALAKLAGWRLTTRNSSAPLQVLDLPYVEVSTCIDNAPTDFRQFVTADKFCAGSLQTNISFCEGDSGSGLVFPEVERGTERFYLRGVLSVAQRTDAAGCSDTYGLFTQLIKHGNFIEQWIENPDATSISADRPETGTCILPAYPDHGSYVTDTPGAIPGQGYQQVTVNVTCQRGYGVFGYSSTYCINGVWQDSVPKCVRLCQLDPQPSVEYRCLIPSSEEGYRSCRRQEPSGTIVSPHCRKPNYYSATVLPVMRCIDSQWNYVARCSLECGRVTPEEHLFYGEIHKRGEVPWHAAIYNSDTFTQVCAGSLISNDIILSAAHCFWSDKKGQLPAVQYLAAVGKIYKEWNDKADDVQKADIKEIQLPRRYQGSTSDYQDDIAVVVVARAFEFNTFVRPVCIDFDTTFESRQLTAGTRGRVAGWKLTTQNCSATLQVVDLPYVEVSSCIENSPSQFRKYITWDKICAGSQDANLMYCVADSGGGLAFPEEDRGTQRYYLRGVLSVAPTDIYALFTQLIKHAHFIEQWTENIDAAPDSSSDRTSEVGLNLQRTRCVLPQYPEHGTYTTNVPGAKPGQDFQLVTLNVSCHGGFGAIGPTFTFCVEGVWSEHVTKCVSTCQLSPHPSVEYRCQVVGNDEGYRPCGTHELEGTKVKPECRKPNYYSTTNLIFMRCKNGQWNYIAKCSPECGKVTPVGAELVIGGTQAIRGEVPWHVGIYRKMGGHKPTYQQVCGGSLVSSTIVISAAHCFWNDVEKQLPASLFAVAVGKIHRGWNNPEDEAQKSEIKEIRMPPRFRGAAANFQDDLAVVLVARAFEFKTFIRPVCLSFDIDIERIQLPGETKGKVAGWGLTAENGDASKTLQVIDLPYVEVATCISNLPFSFQEYITSDKICAGTLESTSGLCRGDSGGGLAFPVTDRGTLRYYLHGVVSTAPNMQGIACNAATYTAFTQIQKHQDFINDFLTEF